MLSSSDTSTEGTFYKTAVRPALQNGAECWARKKQQEHQDGCMESEKKTELRLSTYKEIYRWPLYKIN